MKVLTKRAIKKELDGAITANKNLRKEMDRIKEHTGYKEPEKYNMTIHMVDGTSYSAAYDPKFDDSGFFQMKFSDGGEALISYENIAYMRKWKGDLSSRRWR